MTKKLEISRELAERLALPPEGANGWTTWNTAVAYEAAKELRALLAADKQPDQQQVFECIGKGGEYTVVATAIGAGTMKQHECLFVYKNADGICFVRTHDDFWDRMQETGKFVHAGEKLPPLIQTLHANGDRIAMEATIALQSQRIADLERGRVEAPFYISIEDWNVLVRDDVATARVRICKANRGPFTEPLYAEQPAPVACTSCDGSGEYIDAIGDWRGYCSCPAGVALKNKPAPIAVVLPERNSLRESFESGGIAQEQFSMGWNACIDKVKELNQ